ncbi:hypothetical protein CCO03_17020 [Comamonas serinivorans]|uniref:Uncharacterized protein n=1 Tax=Comamonas serinivorans TaxID=1082851 RepID=A0A1Y0ERL6_9BURK|nr:hypothetical protein [Comamonas serinivorans]ARU06148.1 hypothetical protein CCO03_17020 [Comamonas serinivorans]
MNPSNTDAPELLRLPVVDMAAPDGASTNGQVRQPGAPGCSYCGGAIRPDGYCKPCMKWGAE